MDSIVESEGNGVLWSGLISVCFSCSRGFSFTILSLFPGEFFFFFFYMDIFFVFGGFSLRLSCTRLVRRFSRDHISGFFFCYGHVPVRVPVVCRFDFDFFTSRNI